MLLGRKYLTERWDVVDGLRLFSRVSKNHSGTPVVLVHGLGVSSRYMTPLAEELSKTQFVCVPDSPGFGRSGKPRHVLGIQELAERLHAWLCAIHLGPALFIGNSMGCQILVELAYIRPAAILGLAFLGPTMDLFVATPLSHVVHLFMDQFSEPPSLIAIQAFDYLGNGPLRTVKTFAKALKHDMLGRASGVEAPCLILRGEHDPLVSQRWVEALASRMPDAATDVVTGAGHALNYNSAPVIAPRILAFWRSRGIPV